MSSTRIISHGNGITQKYEPDGTEIWQKNGNVHRDDDLPAMISKNVKRWFINGKLHREIGPAIETTSGTKMWYRNGQRHREDKPAIENEDGSTEWFINGQKLSQQQINAINLNKELKEELSSKEEKPKAKKIKI